MFATAGSRARNPRTPPHVFSKEQWGAIATVASTGTIDLGQIPAVAVSITGTTTITSFGTGLNLVRFLSFTGALTLTHNATSLSLPNAGSNITTAAGDRCVARSDHSGNWTVVSYQKADGTALVGASAAGSGTEIQYKNGTALGAMSGTAWDDTNRSLVVTGATVTTSKPILDLSQTWNAGGVTFTGLKVNVTDTASAAASLLQDWQVGGATKAAITKGGAIKTVGDNASEVNSFQTFYNSSIEQVRLTTYGNICSRGDIKLSQTIGSADKIWMLSTGAILTAGYLGFGTSASGTIDAILARSGAKVVSVEGASSTGATFRHIPTRPSQITADQNNYAPGGASKLQYWTTDAARTITGLSLSQVDGQVHEIWNVGSNNIVLANESASSTAANRFQNTTGADITLAAKQMAFLRYDNTQSRWLVTKGN